ncbi:hypothetical protein BJ508DRAFT_323533 [Ascobolus immersus RN42]|uniref:Uncharacterized protein n=1 Tax=Ascobolus immersus RN42 TaxID=1160509 RepID=A0A3N4IGR7_ASCIM|nr:hypothetical protein BJ508DRAFT_323533 [Ascobolus immersus RN42]
MSHTVRSIPCVWSKEAITVRLNLAKAKLAYIQDNMHPDFRALYLQLSAIAQMFGEDVAVVQDFDEAASELYPQDMVLKKKADGFAQDISILEKALEEAGAMITGPKLLFFSPPVREYLLRELDKAWKIRARVASRQRFHDMIRKRIRERVRKFIQSRTTLRRQMEDAYRQSIQHQQTQFDLL